MNFSLKLSNSFFSLAIICLFIIALPFLHTFNTLDPSLSLRTLIFSISILILSVFFFIKKTKFFKLNTVSVFLLLILIISILSFFFSGGIKSESLQFIVKISLFLILLIFLDLEISFHKKKIYLIKSVTLFTSVIVFYTMLDYFHIIKNNNDNTSIILSLSKAVSVITNKNLLASILFLSIPFNIYSFKYFTKYWRYFSAIIIIISFLIMLLTLSRAVFLALILYLITFLILFISSKIKLKIKLLFFVFIVGSLSLFFKSKSGNEFINKINDRWETVSTIDNIKNTPRWGLYSNTVKIIKNSPLLGVGPGNWKYKIGEQSKLYTKGEDGYSLPQRPHNDFLWLMSETGLFSGFLYLSIFIILLFQLIKKIKNPDNTEIIFHYFLISAILGYAIISFLDFPFERIEHLVLFSLLISIIMKNENIKSETYSNPKNKLIFLLTILISLTSVYISYAKHSSEIRSKKALYYKDKNQWSRMIKETKKAYKMGLYEIDRSGTPLDWYLGLGYFNLNKIDKAFESFKKAYELNPYHLHVLNNLATCYELKGFRQKAIKHYKEALYISPRFEDASVNLAAIYYNEKKYEDALDIILRCNIAKDTKKYNLYLSTIFNSFITANYKNKKSKNILRLQELIDKDQNKFYQEMRKIYIQKRNQNKTYLELIN